MLDNWDIASIKEAVLFIDNHVPIEVSGNMDIEKSSKVAQMGVDFVSEGAINPFI
jgi:nicotinate-nucleotide pyrophosphorylase (carboxylating)